jgi:hypothetical protein
MTAAGEYFLSRLRFGAQVLLGAGHRVDVLRWLGAQRGPFVDQPILLGQERLACRLIAWRLPEEQANRRRQKLCQETRSKRGREPSVERLAWCDWTILVTNAAVDKLTPKEATVLYRARWQVEKAQADYPSRRRWGEARRIGYHRRNGVARTGRVLPATPGCLHRRNRMSDNTRPRSAPPRA